MLFTGRVQGVFFRATARDLARSMDLVGTVQNMPDGTVLLFAQGSKEQLTKLVEMLQKEFRLDQPPDVSFYPKEREFEDFTIVYP